MLKIKLNQRMATKMISLLLVVILIPSLLISIFFFKTASSIVKMNERQSAIQIARQAADSISNIFNVGSDTSEFVYGQVSMQELVMQDDMNLPKDVAASNRRAVVNMLNNIIYSNTFVKIVYILKEKGESWGSGLFSQAKLERYKLSDFSWIQKAYSLNGQLVWMPIQYDKFSGAGDNTELVIPAVRVFKDFKTLHNIGYVMINIDGKAVLNKISDIRLGQSGYFFVTDPYGNIMIHRDLSLIGTRVENYALLSSIAGKIVSEFEFEDSGEAFYGVKMPLSNGWQIVGVVPIKEITGDLEKLRNAVFWWSFAFSILAIAVGLFFARKITMPIQKLIHQMKLVEDGDLQARTTIHSTDEIGSLSKQFNRMILKLNQLMVQVSEEQAMKQRAEMRAVMHRINPHFMFNTLSTLKWLIKFGENQKAYDGISAFNRLLEANMGKKGPMITLAEEVDIIAKYLAILQLRYTLQFQLNVRMSEGTEHTLVPRMLIQPIVENAIFHGIVPSGKDGTIAIEAEEKGGTLTIQIMDNGLGMDEAKVNQLNALQTMREFTDSEGIGLRHVFECVKFYFSEGSQVLVSSDVGKGTLVELRIKKESTPEGSNEGGAHNAAGLQ